MTDVEDLTATIRRRRRRRSRSPSRRAADESDERSEESSAQRRVRQQADKVCNAVLSELTTIDDNVVLRPSTLGANAGLGLFVAERRIAKNQPITRYEGELIRQDEARRRLARGEATHLRRHIPLRWVLDGTRRADGTRIGAPRQEMSGRGGGAYANDPIARERANAVFDFVDCEANRLALERFRSGTLPLRDEPFDPLERISFLRATRDIEPGEEVFVNYGDDYWRGQRPLSLPESASGSE